MISDTNLLGKIENKDTVARFKSLIQLAKDVQEIPSDTTALCNVYGVKAKSHGAVAIDLKAFEESVEEKYMGIFTMFDHYSAPAAKVARLINFIDEKS
jgi:hypothetical protein